MTKVLIAYDTKYMRLFIKQILENKGFKGVEQTINGQEDIIKARKLKKKWYMKQSLPVSKAFY